MVLGIEPRTSVTLSKRSATELGPTPGAGFALSHPGASCQRRPGPKAATDPTFWGSGRCEGTARTPGPRAPSKGACSGLDLGLLELGERLNSGVPPQRVAGSGAAGRRGKSLPPGAGPRPAVPGPRLGTPTPGVSWPRRGGALPSSRDWQESGPRKASALHLPARARRTAPARSGLAATRPPEDARRVAARSRPRGLQRPPRSPSRRLPSRAHGLRGSLTASLAPVEAPLRRDLDAPSGNPATFFAPSDDLC